MSEWHESAGVHVSEVGRRIGWLLRGPVDGQPVLWMHGQPGSRADQNLLDEDTLRRFNLRILSIDRAGYGHTDSAGMDRRDVAADALAVADLHNLGAFTVIGVSMGGIYALTLAVLAPTRVLQAVIVSGHVLPYDDEAIIADLSEAEQQDVAMLRGGRTAELEAVYRDFGTSLVTDFPATFAPITANWSDRERTWFAQPVVQAGFIETFRQGLTPGATGMLDDGLRTIRPLEFDIAHVTCPVRLLHGDIDNLEPLANIRRLLKRLPDASLLVFEGMNHVGPWVWPGVVPAVLAEFT